MYQLAIDVGTTQIKFDLFYHSDLIKSKKIPVITYYENDGKVYQHPNEIIEKVQEGILFFTSSQEKIESILLSTAMHSVMPVFDNQDSEEMYIWLDQRASKWVKKFKKDTEKAREFYLKTGTPIHEMSPFAKIASFKKEVWFSSVSKWFGIKEWLMMYLTKKEVVDYSVASATGLFNSESKTWDEEILSYLSLSTNQLAKLVDTDWSTPIDNKVAEKLGLSTNTQVFIGASDGCLASLASYVANGTTNSLTIGTSGAVRKLSKNRQLDDKGQSFCYYVNKEYWVIGGATNNGGKVLEWASEMFYEKSSIYDQLDHILEKSPIGSRGVLFLPYISGERAPLWTSEVTGEFLGLRLGHTKEDMLRSVIEGILLNAKWISNIIELDDRSVSLSGGFFSNQSLVELTADVIGRKCFISPYVEPSFGLIALISKGTTLRNTEIQPVFYNQENKERYESYYQKFIFEVKNERL